MRISFKMENISQDESFASNYLLSNSKSSSNSDPTSLSVSRSRSSFDLLAQTFSASSVDICQVIHSKEPPMVPLRMEMKSSGFETVRTKRDTLSICLQKVENAKKILEMTQTAVSYSSYQRTYDSIYARRKSKKVFDETQSIDSKSSSKSDSSSVALDETFSAGSVDICQVIRSDRPPMVPIRMELNCDGFETVRTKRKAIHDCVKMCIGQKSKIQNGVTYSSYTQAHSEAVSKRKSALETFKSRKCASLNRHKPRLSLGVISEDKEPEQDEKNQDKEICEEENQDKENQVIKHQGKDNQVLDDQRGFQNELRDELNAHQSIDDVLTSSSSSSEWAFQPKRNKYAKDEFVEFSHQEVLFSSQRSSMSCTSTESSASCFSSMSQKDEKSHGLLFNDTTAPGWKEVYLIPEYEEETQNPDITAEKRTTNHEQDRYCAVNENKKPNIFKKSSDKYDPIKEGVAPIEYTNIKLDSPTGELSSKDPHYTHSLWRDEAIRDDLSNYSITSSFKTSSSEEMISFDDIVDLDDEDDDYIKMVQNDHITRSVESSIMSHSEYMTVGNKVIITFDDSSDDADDDDNDDDDDDDDDNSDTGLSECLPGPINSLRSSEDHESLLISLASEEESEDNRYKIPEDEKGYTDDKYQIAEIMHMTPSDFNYRNQKDIGDKVCENFYSDDDSDKVKTDYIPIGEYNFQSAQYLDYIGSRNHYRRKKSAQQYHAVDDQYLYSTLNQVNLTLARLRKMTTNQANFDKSSWRHSYSLADRNDDETRIERKKEKI